jgi:hypothetical protein
VGVPENMPEKKYNEVRLSEMRDPSASE